jgi:iron-sulfur cluster insertion protein
MIHITDKAISKIKEISEAEGVGHLTVRLKVVGGGCAGFTQDMHFDDIGAKELDEVIEMDGVTILVDPMSMQYMDETTLDFVESQFGTGFKFLNPNVKSSCGCGSSVSF